MVSPLCLSGYSPLIFDVQRFDHVLALADIWFSMQLVHEFPLVTLDRTKVAIVEPLAEAQIVVGILIVVPEGIQFDESGRLLREALDLGGDEE